MKLIHPHLPVVSPLIILALLPLNTLAGTPGQATYQEACASCHESGLLGAPKPADRASWTKRLEQPTTTLEQHAIKGLNAMPAKGGRNDLSDEAVIAAVRYMLGVVDNPAMVSNTTPEKIQPSSTQDMVNLLKGDSKYHIPPGEDEIPNDKYGDDVRLGKKIFTQTGKYASRYAGNGLSCSNCHIDAGRKPHSAPLWAAYGMYPAYRKKNDRSNTLEERIQQCFRFSMNGFSPALDTPEVRALVSYAHFLSKGAPIGVDMPGRGYPQIINTGYDANPTRGGDAYKSKCATCHGSDGAGKENDNGSYTFPPLWGSDSYNKGAGLATNKLLAGFIKANMPIGQEWTLTDQEALDIASYINLQIRPWDPRKGIFD